MPRGKKRKQAEALSGSEASKHLAALDEALEILDAWDDVADSELTGVLSQLASLLRISEEALVRMHSCDKLPFDRLSAVLVRSCGHASAPVRVAGWMAARECCLDQQELCEMLLLERALYSSAWSQLRDGAAGAATSAIVGLLQQACELSDEAVVAAGEAELTALLAAASPPVAERTREAGADAHGEAQVPDMAPNSEADDDGAAVALAALVPRALRCLGAACAQAADAGHAPPEDAAMRAALEALTNAYIGGNDADECGADRRTGSVEAEAGAGEAEDAAATKSRAGALARRARQLLPPAKLLPLVLGSLQRYLGVYEEAKVGEATGPGMLDDRGYVAEMITEIGVELSRRLEASEEPLEGAEAAAALAEDADCSRRSGEPPLVSADQFRRALHELRGKLVSALRDVATRRRAAREAEEDEGARAREEKLRHALALVEAAAEQV